VCSFRDLSSSCGLTYGGGVSIPLTEGITLGADASRISVDRFGPATHTFVSPAVVWSGADFPFGTGADVCPEYGDRIQADPARPPGAVISPAEPWSIRTEVCSAWQYAVPFFGMKVGVG
jgi:hypothetical protein